MSLFDLFESETEVAPDETEEIETTETHEVAETTEAAETTEEFPEEIILPESAIGMLELSLADKSVKIPAFFDNELTLELGEFLSESLFAENEGYTLTFDGGIFHVERP